MKAFFTLLVICTLALLPAKSKSETAEPHFPCYLKAEFVEAHDGDTCHLNILLPGHLCLRDVAIRAADYDAWEIAHRTGTVVTDAERAKGKTAREAFVKLMTEAKLIYVEFDKKTTDSFGRYLVYITILNKDNSTIKVGEFMEKNGHCRKE